MVYNNYTMSYYKKYYDDDDDSDTSSDTSSEYYHEPYTVDDLTSDLQTISVSSNSDLPIDLTSLTISDDTSETPETESTESEELPLDLSSLRISERYQEPELHEEESVLDLSKLQISDDSSTPPLKLDIQKLIGKRKFEESPEEYNSGIEKVLTDFFVSDKVKTEEPDDLSYQLGKMKISPPKRRRKAASPMNIEYDENAPRYFLRQIIKKPARFGDSIQLVTRKDWSVSPKKSISKRTSSKFTFEDMKSELKKIDKGKGKAKRKPSISESDSDSDSDFDSSKSGPSKKSKKKSKRRNYSK